MPIACRIAEGYQKLIIPLKLDIAPRPDDQRGAGRHPQVADHVVGITGGGPLPPHVAGDVGSGGGHGEKG